MPRNRTGLTWVIVVDHLRCVRCGDELALPRQKLTHRLDHRFAAAR
jgi:hypothetical protein